MKIEYQEYCRDVKFCVSTRAQIKSPEENSSGVVSSLTNRFNVFGDDFYRSSCYKNGYTQPHLQRQESLLSIRPLFTSLFENRNTVNHQCNTKYNKPNSKRQGEIFEKAACN